MMGDGENNGKQARKGLWEVVERGKTMGERSRRWGDRWRKAFDREKRWKDVKTDEGGNTLGEQSDTEGWKTMGVVKLVEKREVWAQGNK